jgi:hypothetical protein
MMEPTDPPEARRRDVSISMAQANLYGLLLLIPAGALLVLPYLALWGGAAFGDAWQTVADNLLPALGCFAAGIVAHEGIHGLSWMIFGRKPRRAIRYGFKLKTLTPYAHCTEPMDARAYRLGAAMPGLLLGVGPWLAGLATGHGPTFLFGLLFTLAALGDAMILWLLRHVPPTAQVIDHPTRAGCYVIEPEGS